MAVVCVLLSCVVYGLLVRVSGACEGKELGQIVQVLEELDDWEALADRLDIKRAAINNIRRCTGKGCSFRELVITFCDSMGRIPVEAVVANISEALRWLDKVVQADKLDRLFPTVLPRKEQNSQVNQGPGTKTTTESQRTSPTQQPTKKFPPFSTVFSEAYDMIDERIAVGVGICLFTTIVLHCCYKNKGRLTTLVATRSKLSATPEWDAIRKNLTDLINTISLHLLTFSTELVRTKFIPEKSARSITPTQALSNPEKATQLLDSVIEKVHNCYGNPEQWFETFLMIFKEQEINVELAQHVFNDYVTMKPSYRGILWQHFPLASRNPLPSPPMTTGPQNEHSRKHISSPIPHAGQQHPQAAEDDLSEPIFDKHVEKRLLVSIKYNDDCGKEKRLHIMKQISPKWKKLAACLGFEDYETQNFAKSTHYQTEDATDMMLGEWMEVDVDSTWRKLIQKMKEVELNMPATNLMKALKSRID